MNQAVIGLGFGDEGKGLVVDYLASRRPESINVRFSGGHQVGHTVVSKDAGFRHVFSNFGSGAFRGLSTYWSRNCTVCPIGLVNELEDLRSKGLEPKIRIDRECALVTPMERESNRDEEKKRQHGSCGVGFGATVQREEDYFSLRFMDIFYPEILEARLQNIRKYYHGPSPWKESDMHSFRECCKTIASDSAVSMGSYMPMNEGIFEGSQGLMLDQRYGFFPNVTRSNTGTKNISDVVDNTEFYLVTRAYQTRHGNGFMTNEDLSHNIKVDKDETNVLNEYQGEFRRSLLDVSLLEYALNIDDGIRTRPKLNLVITCLDHVENDYRFTYKGEVVACCDEEEFVDKVSRILGVFSVYVSRSSDSANIEKVK